MSDSNEEYDDDIVLADLSDEELVELVARDAVVELAVVLAVALEQRLAVRRVDDAARDLGAEF